jgi:pimeloyl-ACP methyl ester carboxylesterase
MSQIRLPVTRSEGLRSLWCRPLWLAGFVALATTASCGLFIGDNQGTTPGGGVGGLPGTGGTGPTLTGAGVGEVCSPQMVCRAGLNCVANPAAPGTTNCQPAADRIAGAQCILSAECRPGLYCSLNPANVAMGKSPLECAPRGVGKLGDTCIGEGDCEQGLTCNVLGLSGLCAPVGTNDIGKACTATSDCLGGLLCLQQKCGTVLTVQQWPGAACPSGEEPTPRIHFKVPRAADAASEDFFALPFPNDIRRKAGKLNMKNFPTPGLQLLPFDPVARYLEAIQTDLDGFALSPTVYFRFTRMPNIGPKESPGSLKGPGVVTVWDLTPGPTFNREVGYGWFADSNRGKYICPRWMALQTSGLLSPGHTYAVVIKAPLADGAGTAFTRDPDFEAVMGATAPADPDLAAAWTAYAPLRDWAANPMSMQNPAQILAAAVFTTQTVEDPILAVRKAIDTAAAPNFAVKGVVKCAAGVVSPCEDMLMGDKHERGCFAEDPAFDEYQALVTFPVLQKGTRPYENPENGGGIVIDAASKTAMVQGSEDVCVAFTVPKGTPPAAGWPVALYAHGTTGSYRSFITQGWAKDFAAGAVPGGDPVPMLGISYDGAMHGTRKGVSMRSVEEMVFNILNPVSARDTALQQSADLYIMAKMIDGFTHDMIKLDKTRVVFYGHSQGANAGALGAAYEPSFKAVVLSGAGADLTQSLLSKKKPVNIAGALPLVVGEPVSGNHPLISVLQMYFERSDPKNFVHRISRQPMMGMMPKHLLHVFGTMDTYSPEPTQKALGELAGLQIAGPAVDAKTQLAPAMVPAKKNLPVVGGGTVTGVQIQYAPEMYDGHFVSTRNAKARAAILQMLGTALRDDAPTVTP